jgi:hypothetical protein
VNRDANFLSPIAAYLAAIASEYEGEAKIEAACNEYVRQATPPGAKRPGGFLWTLGIVSYTIDDAYYAYAGN